MVAAVSNRVMGGFGRGTRKTKWTFGQLWIGGLFIILSASRLFPSFEHTTQVAPHHDDIIINCFCAALAVAVFSVGVAISEDSGKMWSRVLTVVIALICGFGGTFVGVYEVSKMWAEAHDFPAGKTQASMAQWPITGLHHTSVRSLDYYYANTKQADVNVSESDYDFMRAHSVDSFCARVPIETSGTAVRLMLGPHDELKSGNILPCS